MGKRAGCGGGGGLGLTVLLLVAALGAPASAAIETRDILKTYFETGDVPTQDQFANLIDSFIHQTDDGLTLYAVGALRGSGTTPLAGSIRTESNVGINESLPDTMLGIWADPSLHPEMEPQWAGQHGFLPLKYQDSAGQPHYGFLQISMASTLAPGAGAEAESAPEVTPPPIFVEYWVWETTPSATLTTFFVPEPASATVLTLMGFGLLRRRARRVTR